MTNSVGIVGAGPGGLAAGVLLQSRGFQVEIFEAQDRIGGRNAQVQLGDFKFDLGPTFFLMPSVLEEIFHNAGVSAADYLKLERVDPLYKLDFGADQELWIHQNKQKMSQEIAKFSARDADMFYSFRDRQKRKFDSILPTLRQPFSGVKDFVKAKNMSALPYLDNRSVYDELCDYFEDERVRLAFTFQAKYLGMSPFDCPSMFTILPHIEHEYGVWHPIGGCNQVSDGLAKLFVDLGGKIHLSTPVEACETNGGNVSALRVHGEERVFDHYVMNADFAYGMKTLFSNSSRKKFKDQRLDKMKYSCSTFMMYLGIEGELEHWPHHAIYFSPNYRKNIRELTETFELSSDPSFYVHNPSKLDPTLAPKGQSAVYILVPAPNRDASVEWGEEETQAYRKLVFDKIQERTGVDLRPRIIEEKVITPKNWEEDYRVFKGATFSLAHTFSQMLYWRPHNNSEEFSNLYIVGGGTHPGSGLPTILESGRIAADLIDAKQKKSVLSQLRQRALSLMAEGPKDLSRLLTSFRGDL